jgi:hypothetical protein
MSIKITIPNTSSDVLTFGSGNTPTAAQIAGIDSGSSNGQLAFYTTTSGTSTERMRIDSSGNLGIGVTPPTSTDNGNLTIKGGNTFNFSTASGGIAANAAWNGGWKYISTAAASLYAQAAGTHAWSVAASGTAGNAITFTQAMTLDASGNLLVGTTTSQDPLTVANGATLNGGGLDFSTSGTKNWQVVGNATDFFIGNQTLSRYAALSGITTFTAWTFVSDVRIKKDVEPINYGLAEVLRLKPSRYKFVDESVSNIGFIAQEVKEVIPEMVVGSGLEFEDQDTPEEHASKVLSVSKETLIPILVKAIQELNARLTALENK